MSNETIDALMVHIRAWLDMSFETAKTSINHFMVDEGGYSDLDFKLLEHSESTEEAIGLVFGI